MSQESTLFYISETDEYILNTGQNSTSVLTPEFALSQRNDCWLAYNAELDEYAFVDKTTNLPIYFVKVDKNGQHKVTMPSADELGKITIPEDINVMPFVYECMKNGLKDIPKQFKDVKKEIKVWLKQKYGIKPKVDGFVDWYIKSKLTHYVKDHPVLMEVAKFFASRKMLANTVGEVDFRSDILPKISNKDIQEYCLFQKESLEVNDRVLKKTFLSPSTENTLLNIKVVNFKWQGPVNDNINQLDDLYYLLNGTYTESSIEVFQGAFGIGPFIEPVKWIGKASELIWLILELQEHDYLKKPKQQNWQTMVHTFVGVDREFSASSLKSMKNALDINLSQECRKKISEIVESL